MYQDAVKIVEDLKKAGFTAYFAGGWVRDYVLKHPSSDIDIATSATPEEVMQLFDNTLPIGKAFGVVLVFLGDMGYEVASFRKDDLYIDGRRPTGICYATPEEDADRRDFTINGLFFDPLNEKVIDFVGGIEDIHAKKLRAIGDPMKRFTEDKLRMIRAIRFSSKLGFTIDPETEKAIVDLAEELYPAVANERVVQEFKKMGMHATFPNSVAELKRLKLLDVIFPLVKEKPHSFFLEIVKKVEKLSPHVHYLLVLSCFFKDFPEKEVVEAFEDLKLSSQDRLDLHFGMQCQSFLKRGFESLTKEEWVAFFAHPLCTEAMAMMEAMSTGFTTAKFHEKRQGLLQPIERKTKGTTLLKSTDLLANNIAPGKLMGLLLKEGESVAIEHNLKTPDEVLTHLKQSPLWPK